MKWVRVSVAPLILGTCGGLSIRNLARKRDPAQTQVQSRSPSRREESREAAVRALCARVREGGLPSLKIDSICRLVAFDGWQKTISRHSLASGRRKRRPRGRPACRDMRSKPLSELVAL